MRDLGSQSGSALVEAAVLFPVLILILYWSIALTDVLILKLKASEAARFALWETTAWKSPRQIDLEVHQRFGDLRSAASIDRAATALLLFPRSSSLRWGAQVDVAAGEVTVAGDRVRFAGGPGILGSFLGIASGWMAGGVQAALREERFNTFGRASARARLAHTGPAGAAGTISEPRPRSRSFPSHLRYRTSARCNSSSTPGKRGRNPRPSSSRERRPTSGPRRSRPIRRWRSRSRHKWTRSRSSACGGSHGSGRSSR